MAFGAPQSDWDHFDLVLGLTHDLLPVVSDPTAEISPLSKMKDKGKTPSHFNRSGQVTGFPEWTKYRATADDVTKWSRNDRLGIALQTRRVRAIDVDISDFDESVDVEAFIESKGFKLPCRRRSNSSKFLLAFTLPGDYTKRRFKTHTAGNAIEFLANGQQFIACGLHPSGVPYEWPDGLPDSIPSLTPDQFEHLWAELQAKFGSEESVTMRTGMTPTKKRRLSDANDDVGEFLESHWEVFDVTDDGRVDIRCPFADGHTDGVSEGSSTSYYLAGVGGFSQGHFRCLHASCAGRKDQDFLNEIGYSAHGFDVIEVETVNESTGAMTYSADLPRGITANLRPLKKGQTPGTEKVIACGNAVFAAIDNSNICGHGIIYDRFRDEVMITENTVDRPLHALKLNEMRWRPLRDDDYFMLKNRLERGASCSRVFEPITLEMMRQAVNHAAQYRSYDSMTQLIKSLQWDSVPRIDTFLRDFMGAEDTPYTRAISRYYWSALAGRALVPGVKADMVPIAVGKQGARKTTLIRSIAPTKDMFVELDLSKSDADLARDMRGKIVGELGEMKGFSAKMIEHIKSFITREKEEWTPKFKEFTTRYLRRCILFGTTNENEPLPADATGQRRWLPFTMPDAAKCSVEQLEEIRDQLWAEAAQLFETSGVAWQDAERLAPQEHKHYEKEDSWTEHLRTYIFTGEMGEPAPIDEPNGLKLVSVITNGLCIPVKEINRNTEVRVANCLRALGFKNITRKQGKVWVRG